MESYRRRCPLMKGWHSLTREQPCKCSHQEIMMPTWGPPTVQSEETAVWLTSKDSSDQLPQQWDVVPLTFSGIVTRATARLPRRIFNLKKNNHLYVFFQTLLICLKQPTGRPHQQRPGSGATALNALWWWPQHRRAWDQTHNLLAARQKVLTTTPLCCLKVNCKLAS